MVDAQPPCPCCTDFFPEGCPMAAPAIPMSPCIVAECECLALDDQMLCEDCYIWTK